MVILNKSQVEIEVKGYKTGGKIKVMFPDEVWTKHHFSKAHYNLKIARINFNLNEHKDFIKKLGQTEETDPELMSTLGYFLVKFINGIIILLNIKR